MSLLSGLPDAECANTDFVKSATLPNLGPHKSYQTEGELADADPAEYVCLKEKQSQWGKGLQMYSTLGSGVAGPFHPSAPLPYDIWEVILKEHLVLTHIQNEEIFQLARLNSDCCCILSPYHYCYVNLRTIDDTFIFFSIVIDDSKLARAVKTLQFSFSISNLPKDVFWAEFHAAMSSLKNQWTITQIPHIHTLVVTLPGYIIQDLTQSGHDKKLLEWTAQLCRQPGFSQLSTIVLNFGYRDDTALAYTDYYNDNSYSDDLNNDNNNNSEFAPNLILNFVHSIQVVWKKQSRKEWLLLGWEVVHFDESEVGMDSIVSIYVWVNILVPVGVYILMNALVPCPRVRWRPLLPLLCAWMHNGILMIQRQLTDSLQYGLVIATIFLGQRAPGKGVDMGVSEGTDKGTGRGCGRGQEHMGKGTDESMDMDMDTSNGCGRGGWVEGMGEGAGVRHTMSAPVGDSDLWEQVLTKKKTILRSCTQQQNCAENYPTPISALPCLGDTDNNVLIVPAPLLTKEQQALVGPAQMAGHNLKQPRITLSMVDFLHGIGPVPFLCFRCFNILSPTIQAHFCRAFDNFKAAKLVLPSKPTSLIGSFFNLRLPQGVRAHQAGCFVLELVMDRRVLCAPQLEGKIPFCGGQMIAAQTRVLAHCGVKVVGKGRIAFTCFSDLQLVEQTQFSPPAAGTKGCHKDIRNAAVLIEM
ncbi:hypothetical protein DFH08DRAFT_813709 [Mycena albidolilacea]|uniref:Uncharacterized protein n=1 Tax=Mycena albidolilacea TaxID=1033008 RepID=A0AAD6ZRD4_9AGAR|nr:hypothetical protein DFH08DRAFT_813709 [Mycena albidolilacea]